MFLALYRDAEPIPLNVVAILTINICGQHFIVQLLLRTCTFPICIVSVDARNRLDVCRRRLSTGCLVNNVTCSCTSFKSICLNAGQKSFPACLCLPYRTYGSDNFSMTLLFFAFNNLHRLLVDLLSGLFHETFWIASMSFQDSAIDDLSGEQIQMFSSLRRSSDHTERRCSSTAMDVWPDDPLQRHKRLSLETFLPVTCNVTEFYQSHDTSSVCKRQLHLTIAFAQNLCLKANDPHLLEVSHFN